MAATLATTRRDLADLAPRATCQRRGQQMTPDEAAALLDVDKDASAATILAAYSAKAKAAGGDHAGDLEAEKAEVQLLGEARVTLMTHRQKTQGTQQRTAVAQRAAGTTTSGGSAPEYGQRAATSAWPDDAPAKGKARSAEEEQIRKQRSFIIALVGLVLSLTAWVWWLLEPLSLFGIGLSIWALVRVRGYGSGLYTGTRIVAWVSIVLGALGLLGNILLVVNGIGAARG
jgi:cobalamin biosynthesis Mg chelatase CobN